MKKITIIFFALVAFVCTTGVLAFTPHRAPLADAWFQYNGTGDYDDPNSYTQVGSPSGCTGVNKLCAIRDVVASGNKPQLSATMVTQIEQAVSSHQPIANKVSLKP